MTTIVAEPAARRRPTPWATQPGAVVAIDPRDRRVLAMVRTRVRPERALERDPRRDPAAWDELNADPAHALAVQRERSSSSRQDRPSRSSPRGGAGERLRPGSDLAEPARSGSAAHRRHDLQNFGGEYCTGRRNARSRSTRVHRLVQRDVRRDRLGARRRRAPGAGASVRILPHRPARGDRLHGADTIPFTIPFQPGGSPCPRYFERTTRCVAISRDRPGQRAGEPAADGAGGRHRRERRPMMQPQLVTRDPRPAGPHDQDLRAAERTASRSRRRPPTRCTQMMVERGGRRHRNRRADPRASRSRARPAPPSTATDRPARVVHASRRPAHDSRDRRRGYRPGRRRASGARPPVARSPRRSPRQSRLRGVPGGNGRGRTERHRSLGGRYRVESADRRRRYGARSIAASTPSRSARSRSRSCSPQFARDAELRRPVPPRGAGGRAPEPPEHRRRLRHGRRRRHAVHRHGVHRGPDARRLHELAAGGSPRRRRSRSRRRSATRSPPRTRRS